jgi:hypothetical protein
MLTVKGVQALLRVERLMDDASRAMVAASDSPAPATPAATAPAPKAAPAAPAAAKTPPSPRATAPGRADNRVGSVANAN